MCNSISDFDRDGHFDIYVTNTAQGNFHMRNDNGIFTNVAEEYGVAVFEWSWSGLWIDYDLDGDDDLHVATRSFPLFSPQNPFYVNNGGNFELLNELGLAGDEFESYCAAKGDFNNDGKWDFVVTNQDPVSTYLWMNEVEDAGHWIKLGFEGTVSNRDGVGTIVRCYHGGQLNLLQTYCGENYLSQDSQYEIIGLGADAIVDSLIVTWPSGWVDRYYNLSVDQFYALTEGETFSATITNANGGVLCATGGSVVLDAGNQASYLWSDGSEQSQLEVTEAGLYSVLVVNEWGFEAAASYEVLDYPDLEFSINGQDPLCYGSSDGSLQVVCDTTQVQSYQWDTGSNLPVLEGVPSSIYTVELTDMYGCHYTQSYTLTDPTQLNVEITNDPILCHGGTTALSAQASGGTGDYMYEWSTPTPEVTPSGTYTVSAIDIHGCSSTSTVTITEPDSLGVTNNTPEVCFGGTTTPEVEVSGGTPPYVLTWSEEDISALPQGDYLLQVSDGNNCTSDFTISIMQGSEISIVSIVLEANEGLNGTIQLDISGGFPPYSYQWSTGAQTNPLTEVGQGYYQCFITDSNNCFYVTESILILDSKVEDNPETTLIQLFPNPFDEVLVIRHPICRTSGTIHILDGQGKMVYESPMSGDQTIIDTQGWESGNYILTIMSNSFQILKK